MKTEERIRRIRDVLNAAADTFCVCEEQGKKACRATSKSNQVATVMLSWVIDETGPELESQTLDMYEKWAVDNGHMPATTSEPVKPKKIDKYILTPLIPGQPMSTAQIRERMDLLNAIADAPCEHPHNNVLVKLNCQMAKTQYREIAAQLRWVLNEDPSQNIERQAVAMCERYNEIGSPSEEPVQPEPKRTNPVNCQARQ